MSGSELITYVRNVLRDVVSSYSQGEFWEDEEILLALNAAQDIFLNNCLKLKQHNFLRWLITRTAYSDNPIQAMPLDYVHYMSAKVGEEDDLKLSELYMGGTAVHHWRTKQAKTMIVNSSLYYRRNRLPAGGRMYYYKRPTVIIDNVFDNSFDDEVYRTQIVNLASVISAMKETSTSRDFKRMKRWISDRILSPKTEDNYVYNWEQNDDYRDIQPPKDASG